MATQQNFRSALNGFNREDVVRYIEYLNSKHKTESNQLRSEIESLKEELATHVPQAAPGASTAEALEAANSRCTQLEQENARLLQELEQAKQQPAPAPVPHAEELEAYRRAERVERMAQERAAQICQQANGILADASAKVDDAAAQLGSMANHVAGQLAELQNAVIGSKQALLDASAAMYAIRPEASEE
ncbi:MAG: hypothetical protein IJX67_05685 [Oscillospiraceae bacterium]|nr:hypothetical protein [Oscillospiraceae bacterium]